MPARSMGSRAMSSAVRTGQSMVRPVTGMSTHRHIPCLDPDDIPAASSAETWSDARKKVHERRRGRTGRRVSQRHDVILRDIMTRRLRARPYHDLSSRLDIPNLENTDPRAVSQDSSSDVAQVSSSDAAPVSSGDDVRAVVAGEPSIGEPSIAPNSISDLDTSAADANAPQLTHLTGSGEAHMVSIAGKVPTSRAATATTTLLFSNQQTYNALLAARLRKGDALAVARVAGIQAAKKTADLIPLAHPGLNITGINVEIRPFHGGESSRFIPGAHVKPADAKYGGVQITAVVACEGKTGVEMEALSAASVAGLTMYDMLKGIDRGMVLTGTRVIAKQGGKSGNWVWDYTKGTVVKENAMRMEETLEQQHQRIKEDAVKDRVSQKQAQVDAISQGTNTMEARVEQGHLEETRRRRWADSGQC